MDAQSLKNDTSSDIRIKTEKNSVWWRPLYSVPELRKQDTHAEHIISVNGEHTHTFTNPDGFAYVSDCFSDAEGVMYMVEPTLEHTMV